MGEAWSDTMAPLGWLVSAILGGLTECEQELIRVGTRDGSDAPRHVVLGEISEDGIIFRLRGPGRKK